MKSDRLLSLLLLLQARGQAPAHELADTLEVSVRTVMRDVEAAATAASRCCPATAPTSPDSRPTNPARCSC